MNSTPKIHEVKDKLESIPGTVPAPSNMPKGCRFHPRCAFATEKCARQAPSLEEIKPGYYVRCWLHEHGEVNLNDELAKHAAASAG